MQQDTAETIRVKLRKEYGTQLSLSTIKRVLALFVLLTASKT